MFMCLGVANGCLCLVAVFFMYQYYISVLMSCFDKKKWKMIYVECSKLKIEEEERRDNALLQCLSVSLDSRHSISKE